VAISSDGRRIVYVAENQGTRQLYLRSLDEFVATPIPGTEGAEGHPFFSPDGESVAFAAAGQLKKVSLMGGSPMTLCDLEGGWAGGSWFEDTIVFGDHGGLSRVSAAGGEPDILATPDSGTSEVYLTPEILPGGKAVLFTTIPYEGRAELSAIVDAQIAVLSLETGKREIVLDEGTHAHYLPTGHLAYLGAQGDLMAVSFDAASLEVSGEAVPVLEGVRRYAFNLDYALSPAGVLIYVPDQEYRHTPVWVDRKGMETAVTQQKREYAAPRISPDGKRVLFSLRTVANPSNIAIYNLEQDSFSRMTFEGGSVSAGIWTPDGNWITFQANVGGQRNIYRQLADRSALPEQLTTNTDSVSKSPNSWSPEGRVLIFSHAVQFPPTGWDLLILDTEANEGPQPFITSPNHECCARFSPDGKWLAYVSGELGRNQVYVRPYPGPDIKFSVSEEAEGGGEPVWSPDGRELFYRSGDRMMAVSIQTEPTFRAGRPEVLFEGSYRTTPIPAGLQYYDISPDGQRFLMIKRERELAQINVVLNWFEELKRLVPIDN
jgi:serine/threonine-protein kinase